MNIEAYIERVDSVAAELAIIRNQLTGLQRDPGGLPCPPIREENPELGRDCGLDSDSASGDEIEAEFGNWLRSVGERLASVG